jgi:DNA polymerase III epsilon subunit-like protein
LCLGEMVRFRLREETSQTELLRRAMETPVHPRADPLPHSAEATAIMKEFKEKHMLSWLDEEIPALNGLTPREAAKSPRSMKSLELLLREFENHEARLPDNERFDIDRLRTELGIPI